MRTPQAVRTVLLLLVALPLAAGCRRSSTGLDAELRGVPTDTVLTLRLGQELRAPDIVMTIGFLAVHNDSRCPLDAMCVWQGNAEVQIGIAFGMGPTVPYALNTGLEPRTVVVHDHRCERWRAACRRLPLRRARQHVRRQHSVLEGHRRVRVLVLEPEDLPAQRGRPRALSR
jgi:hypothetical protein